MVNTNELLITAGFMEKFAEKSKNTFRAEQVDSNNFEYIILLTDVKHDIEYKGGQYIIQILNLDNCDTIISWNLQKDDENNLKSTVNVICKGTPVKVYLCKYQKQDGILYYAFIINSPSDAHTIDITKFGEKKNSVDNWKIYCGFNLQYAEDENKVNIILNVKNSFNLFTGTGTYSDPYKEGDKYLVDPNLPNYTLYKQTPNEEFIYVTGPIPEKLWVVDSSNSNYEVTEDTTVSVSGVPFILDLFIYYMTTEEEKIYLEPYLKNENFLTNLKLSNAGIFYLPAVEVSDMLDVSYETSFSCGTQYCELSESSEENNGTIDSVFQATKAYLAKQADNAIHAVDADQARHAALSDTTLSFSANKTIKFDESNEAILQYGEPISTSFSEEEITLPGINFKGVEIKLVDDSNNEFDIDALGNWFNTIFVKPDHKGLVCKVGNRNTALPYEKDSSDLYFRIDDSKSIENGSTSIDYDEPNILLSSLYLEDTLTIEFTLRPICVFYKEDESISEPLYFQITNPQSLTSDSSTITVDNVTAELDIHKNATGNTDSANLVITVSKGDTQFDSTVQVDGITYNYKWAVLPTLNITNIGDCGFESNPNEEYVTLFKNAFSVDRFGFLSSKKIIILGNDGLLIKKGIKEFKFQI